MIKRSAQKEAISLSKQYRVVTILGPRQSGKTTLAQAAFPKKKYVSLEDPDIRGVAELDPRGFLQQFDPKRGVILDEIQRVPDLLSYIQTRVDRNKLTGEFILTGSAQFKLVEAISQSLAGRTAILKLLPLSLDEISRYDHEDLSPYQLIHRGFYPAIVDQNLDPNRAYRNYFETYVERDVRLIKNIDNLDLFRKFIKICAGRIGSIFSMESIANEVGVSQPTIRSWASVLEASFIVFFLQPYYENISKRVMKRPKLYFYDTGLASYLLGIEKAKQMERDPLYGALFENMVILEAMKSRINQGLDSNLYFYRDNHNNEVDLIYKSGRKLVPIEIKSASTFHSTFLNGLNYFKALPKLSTGQGYVIYAGEAINSVKGARVVNFRDTKRLILES